MFELVKVAEGYYSLERNGLKVGHMIAHKRGFFTGRKYDHPEVPYDSRGPMVDSYNPVDCYNDLLAMFR